MKMTWWGILLALAVGANANVHADELPAPAPVPEAAPNAAPVNEAPVAVEPDNSPACADGRCGKSCWQKFRDWACYRPCHLTPCGACHRFAPPTPPLYAYFLYPPCKEGCGRKCCKDGCNGGHCSAAAAPTHDEAIGLVGATTPAK